MVALTSPTPTCSIVRHILSGLGAGSPLVVSVVVDVVVDGSVVVEVVVDVVDVGHVGQHRVMLSG